MGCDIHLFVQYKRLADTKWNDFGGRIRAWADYDLFGRLADGVRTSPNGYKVRGIPTDLDQYSAVWNEFYDYIDNPEATNNITEQQAINAGKKTYSDSYNRWTENSDIHSHSYLSVDEYNIALSRRENETDYKIEPVYKAVLSAMQTLNQHYDHVRIVFGFDN